ncbi:amidohydrolase family protein [Bradyrhizobium sp. LTSP857]|jgi:D-galactarolactone isomerase|uniref:amidohydrolase family protein n=1 Tax=Bradyrhizobium sp. LTSP857 TaxID=1619231 RepID=UPI0005D15700|nr:amidohydrolase family protein [Bradyrhizobium sp. LTSP857]KJC53292.1 2-pyrone-4,6-dicarboxylate hydrolase [Bradyrhizobium sp. LTSP857]
MSVRNNSPKQVITRRGILAGMLAASTGALAAGVEQAVPNSTGSAPPRLSAPVGACDCHHHIYDGRFPVSPHWHQGFPPGATVADYRNLQRRLGTSRSVVVQPSTYGVDNRCLVDALGQLGSASRGVAVVDTDVKDAELQTLTDAGVRAIRVNFVSPQTWGTTTPEMLTTLARRVSPFGWHVQILMTGDQIVTHESVIRSLPTRVVIDHLGRIPQPDGVKHPAFAAVRRMLDEGRTWVKVTEPYEDSKLGPPYADSSEVARAYVQAAPERILWGTDWPHPTQRGTKPDDALLLDLLADWAPEELTRRRILVDNPTELFGF